MSSAPPAPVRCRQIGEADLGAITDLLAAGFPARTRGYWSRALAVLAARPEVGGCPRFGFMLEAGGVPVGVVLLIAAASGDGEPRHVRCNISSWYVAPEARAYGAMLSAQALKLKHVTYLNISPAPHTLPLLSAQGYRRYNDGQFISLPALSPSPPGAWVRQITADDRSADARDVPEFDLLVAHAAAGCLSLVCETEAGPHPFVFLRRRMGLSAPGVVQLAWCRDTADFAACAGAVGRFLVSRGGFAVVLDADAPVPGLVGKFFKGKSPKFFKGAERPRLNDLAFTEAALFGA